MSKIMNYIMSGQEDIQILLEHMKAKANELSEERLAILEPFEEALLELGEQILSTGKEVQSYRERSESDYEGV